MSNSCELCHGMGRLDATDQGLGCQVCGKTGYFNEDCAEIARLRAIIANRDRKLREWAERADGYDVAVGTVVRMITEELLEDHG